jgi:hypothetical protein
MRLGMYIPQYILGAVLENIVFDNETRLVDYSDTSITENTRCAYPLNYIPNAMIPAKIDTHPKAVILLCCDAFGVLPPISKLTAAQVQYYFISGYTAKVAGTQYYFISGFTAKVAGKLWFALIFIYDDLYTYIVLQFALHTVRGTTSSALRFSNCTQGRGSTEPN